MASARDFRRCALQVLYQFDSGNTEPEDVVRASLEESPGDPDAHNRGFALARDAWAQRDEADEAVGALTPEWPTRRQPVIDRSILRLAHYEMKKGRHAAEGGDQRIGGAGQGVQHGEVAAVRQRRPR
jgi:transcription termination factor NusB